MGPTTPLFFYGTAWKEKRTTELTLAALLAGFRAIDTANQRKHYSEADVGEALQQFLNSKSTNKACSREDLFLQTKFTYARGQDHRKPYDENDSYSDQVAASFASSLNHLSTPYIDSYVLHGPYGYPGISEEDLETWAAMETLVDKKKVKHLGVSNISAKQLLELCKQVRIQPDFVQNRCFAQSGWDFNTREVCKSHNISYQGFSLLTANLVELSHPKVKEIAAKYAKDVPQIVFRFCIQSGIICLTGTTDPKHMKSDLDIFDFELNSEEVLFVQNVGKL